MKTPRFQHLSGADLWQRCDFEGLQLHLPTASIQLATREQVDGGIIGQRLPDTEFHQARQWRGGAQLLCCPPDHCASGYTLLADPASDLLWLADKGWQSLAPPPVTSDNQQGSTDDTLFSPIGSAAGKPLFDQPASLAADPYGRLWLLERGTQRIRLLAAEDLRPLGSIEPPAGARLDDLAACSWGLLACDVDRARLWCQAYGGEWQAVELAGETRAPVAVTGHPEGPAVALLRSTDAQVAHGLLRLMENANMTFDITDLDNPLHLLLAEPERLYIGEARPPTDRPAVALFSSYLLDSNRLALDEQWENRGFDGRALFVGADCRVWGTTPTSARPLVAAIAERVDGGRVETFALDSDTIACQWHRVFIDACLPPGTRLEVSVRTDDALPAPVLQRPARPPHGLSEPPLIDEPAVAAGWQRRPLASRTPGTSRVGSPSVCWIGGPIRPTSRCPRLAANCRPRTTMAHAPCRW
jgi:hypothetical protein